MQTRSMFNITLPLTIIAMLVVSVVTYPALPALIPSQWSLTGEVNSYMVRELAVVFLPMLALGLWLLQMLLPRMDPLKAHYEAFAPSYRRIWRAVAVFLLILHILMLTQYEQPGIMLRGVFFGVALLFAVLGNEMGRIRQTWFVGIRTPWTLADERVWRTVHRVGARWMTAVGVTNMVLVVMLPPAIAGAVLIGSILLVAVALFAYSYVVYQRLNG